MHEFNELVEMFVVLFCLHLHLCIFTFYYNNLGGHNLT